MSMMYKILFESLSREYRNMLFFRDYFGVFEKSQFDCNIISFVQSDARRRNPDIRSDTSSKQALVEAYGLEFNF
jgi:hypothetical protein